VPTDEAEFTQVFRGYDKDEVDAALQGLRRDVIRANASNVELGKEVKRLTTRLDEVTAELEEVGSPTYAGLGTKLEHTLRVAEEQSTRVIAQADVDAALARAAAADDAGKMRSDAHEQAERTLSDAAVRAGRILDDAVIEAEHIRSTAREQGAVLLEQATTEAAQIRGAVATEAAELRSSVRRESAVLRSETEREAAESRAGLVVELATRREEFEREQLARHQHAVSETQKYLEQATRQLSALNQRILETRSLAEELDAGAREGSRLSRIAAEEEAARILHDAQEAARASRSAGEDQTRALVVDAEKRLAQIRIERDAVAGYFESLRGVLLQAERSAAWSD
jgi:DivIVA domain-containing protein